MTEFSFSKAIAHWADTPDASRFLWRYLLACIVFTFIGLTLAYLVAAPLFDSISADMAPFSGDRERAEEAISQAINQNWQTFLWLGLLGGLGGLAVWAALEAAIQRHYIRGEGFSLRFGADELRLMVIPILLAVCLFPLYFIMAIILGLIFVPILTVLGAASGTPFIAMLYPVTLLAIIMLVAVRFSAASALTIRDRRVQFSKSWTVTGGISGRMFAAYLVLGGLIMIGSFLLETPMFAFPNISSIPELMIGSSDYSSTLFGLIAAYHILYWTYQSFTAYLLAGIAALAVKADPDYESQNEPIVE